MAIAEAVKSYLTQKSVHYELETHPYSGSSHETSLAAHVSEDHIAKGVIVKDASSYAMVIIPAINYVEMKHVRKELDRELELVEENEFGKLFPDCEAGDHENLLHISGDGFKTLLRGVRHGHYSHEKHPSKFEDN